MFVVFSDGTVHEANDLKMDHKENIASYTALHDNDQREVNITNIESFSDVMPEVRKKKDMDLVIG